MRQYIGQYTDTSGLSYLNARYYNPNQAQFLTEDPMFWKVPKELLTDPQQMNSYSYGRDNPITMSDPTGESSMYSWVGDPFGSMFYTGSLAGVIGYSQYINRPVTAALLTHSLSLNPGDIYAGNGSVYTSAITSSALYQSALRQALSTAGTDGKTSIQNQILPLNYNGLGGTNGDAATAFGKIDVTINATKGRDGSWQVSGRANDLYDFDREKYNNPAFNTVNNIAYFGQGQGTVTNFTTHLNFSQTILPSQTFKTPSGAVVRWDGSLVSGPPQKK